MRVVADVEGGTPLPMQSKWMGIEIVKAVSVVKVLIALE
jgi:hypothetical protein